MKSGLLFLLCAACLQAQATDVAVVGGVGVSGGEEQDSTAITAVGASWGIPVATHHRFQADYLFHRVSSSLENRHFVTASYVRQGTGPRTRPFFQVGAGIITQTFGAFGRLPSPLTPQFSGVQIPSDTSFALVLGTGVSITLPHQLYVRPELRLYAHVGPTLTLLPAVAFGYRF